MIHQTPQWVDSVLNLIFPPTCLGCGESVTSEDPHLFLCAGCQSKIQLFGASICTRCGAANEEGPVSECRACPRFETGYSQTRCALAYATPLKELIHQFKFYGGWRVRPLLFDLFREGARRQLNPGDYDVIVPVPLHWQRRFVREFNQAELLGELLAREWGIPLAVRGLKRVRHTHPQSLLAGKWREENIAGAFVPGRQSVAGARVLLVDDVMTTGRTLAECASVLMKAGAAGVVGYTLARRH